jgi:thioredoxin-dependent peroxiredoxin
MLRACLLLALTLSFPAYADLQPGDKAPDFTTEATLGGTPFEFTLSEALKKGPVVLYFFPAAFTKGCTVEAHLFAEATDDFAALGATVIGISKDDIETLNRFSISECRNKFAVASDTDLSIAKSFEAKMPIVPVASRVSFVILPDSTIGYTWSALKPDEHITNTLAAVREWHAAQPQP